MIRRPPRSTLFPSRRSSDLIVLEENNDYSSVTSSSMPYLTGLAAQYGLATQYYANTHPSIGNYFELATGQVRSEEQRLNSSHLVISYAVFCLKKKNTVDNINHRS